MPTNQKMLNFAVPEKLHERLKDFRFDQRIDTLSQAIRKLLDESLTRYEKKKKKSSP